MKTIYSYGAPLVALRAAGAPVEAALKNEAGGDEKHVLFFFTWPKGHLFLQAYSRQ